MPTWLSSPGPVLLKRHVRANKTDPLVDEVQLLQANPQYAHIRHADGRETTVSIRHLAPHGGTEMLPSQDAQIDGNSQHGSDDDPIATTPGDTTVFEGAGTPAPAGTPALVTPARPTPARPSDSSGLTEPIDTVTPTVETQVIRRSQRERRPPNYC